jgi:TonB-linked SusC/RagA family outer membrane protein
MRRISMLLLCMVCITCQLFAQNRIVKGLVTDDKGLPVVNASVTVKGNSAGTTTDNAGKFTIAVSNTAKTLIVSSLNFESTEIPITGKSEVSIQLKTSTTNLDEVVIVGYSSQKKKEVTGAISKVSGKDIENLPVQSLDRAIQGRAPGVVVQANNGIPGGAVDVKIRGAGSITAGSTPLYVVDGVQMNTDLLSTQVTQANPLAFLNTNDVASIEILKDAAAAAIYGAKAANGVVLVTTKKGRAGKTQFTLNSYLGQASPLKYISNLTSQQYYQLRYEDYIYQNVTNPNYLPATARAAALADVGLGSTASDKDIADLQTYDWQRNAVYQTGVTQNVDLSISGGNDKTTFFMSGSYNKQNAIVYPVSFKRGTFFSSVKHTVNSKLSIETNINLSSIYQDGVYAGGGGVTTAFGSPTYAGSLMVPVNPIYNADGSFYGMPGSGQPFRGAFNQNVVATSSLDTKWKKTNQLVGSIALNYEIIKGLKYRGQFSLDYRQIHAYNYQDPRNPDSYNVQGFATEETQWNTNFINTHTLNYANNFGSHNIAVLAGAEYRSDINEGLLEQAQTFPSSDFRTINSAATSIATTGFWTGNKIFSLFGKINYDYQKKYLLSFTIRRDGSSRFGLNNLYGTFPSASAGWNVISEDFMKNSKLVSDLKVRVSYGQNGNDQIGNFQSRGLYGATRVYNNGSALTPSQIANPDLHWELREEVNAGLDFGFLHNRITGSLDVYRRVNRDLLLDRPLNTTTGFTTITQNLGKIENKGIELLLSTVNFDGAFKWTTTFNIAFQKNKILSLYDTLQFLPSNLAIRVGAPVGSNYTALYNGVNPATGRAMWLDVNGDITYNPATADRKLYGDNNPKQVGGLANTFSYKNFEVDVFFNYEYGRINQDGLYVRMTDFSRLSNTYLDEFSRRWQKPGDVTDVPRPNGGASEARGANFTGGTRSFFKQDYVRLKQVTVTYNLPGNMAKRMGINSARLYVQAVNLWTYTKWPGYDPEFNGDDRGLLPQSKNVTVGLTVGF